jgi:hypothetical protein
VRHAARGTRNLDSQDEPIADPEMAAVLRRRGRSIMWRSLAGAGLITAIFWIL